MCKEKSIEFSLIQSSTHQGDEVEKKDRQVCRQQGTSHWIRFGQRGT